MVSFFRHGRLAPTRITTPSPTAPPPPVGPAEGRPVRASEGAPEGDAAFERVLGCVHALSDCAKEFWPEHPYALTEHTEALCDALDAWGAAVDAKYANGSSEPPPEQRLRELHGQALGWEIRYDLLRERLAELGDERVAVVLAEFAALPPIPDGPSEAHLRAATRPEAAQ